MPAPLRFVFVGDLHTGSVTALAPKTKTDRSEQVWLAEKWQEFTKSVLSVKGPYVLMLGGDLVEGHHHGSKAFWGNAKEQRDGSIELLQPLANKAGRVMAVLGTEAHAGDYGENDAQVAQELGAKVIRQHVPLYLKEYGQFLSWSHHGMTAAQDASLADNGLLAAIKRVDELYKARLLDWAVRRNDDAPRRYTCIISHHAHRSPEPVKRRGMWAGLCGCWQEQTAHGYKIAPRAGVDIGALIWTPEIDRLERVVYAQKEVATVY